MLLLHQILILLLIPLVWTAEDYYKLLDISRDASDRQIKKAYRTLSKKYHPDKNSGDPEAHSKFVAIAEAYEVLIDDEARRIYNKHGHEGVKQYQQSGGGPGASPHHDPFDLFSRFFGGSGHFGGAEERRGPNIEISIQVPLKDFYNGNTIQFEVEKQVICSACEGSGSEDGKVHQCPQCGGRGMQVQRHMLAPGIFQQVQTMCGSCGGKGKKVVNPCKTCKGTRVTREKEMHELDIEKGMPAGMRVKFENEADEGVDWVAGDLYVVLQEAERKIPALERERTDGMFFRRRGKDLFWREVLSLREAWMGDWTRNITHLDNHLVQLGRPRGKVVQPDTVEMIKGEGMPTWSRTQDEAKQENGNLYIEYLVVLPDRMQTGMESDFWTLWEKWRKKLGTILDKDSGRLKTTNKASGSKSAPSHTKEEL